PSYVEIDGSHALGKTYLIEFTNDVTDKAAFDSAEYNFKRSHKASVVDGNLRSQIENNVTLSELYLKSGNLKAASDALNAANDLVKGTSINEMKMDVFLNYSELYNRTGNYEQAAFFQKKYIALKDSLLHSRLNEIVSAHTSINERENLQTIAFKDSVIERQQSLTIAIVIIAVLVGLLGLVLYRNNRIKNRVNAALTEAKAIIEDQNRQLLNSNIHLDRELKERNADLEKANESLTKANEELDNFIYKTSHDIRGPLATLKGMCNVALLDVKDDLAISYLHKLDITAEKLNSILTRLLVVNQINSSTVGKQPIDFDQMVTDVINIQVKKGFPEQLQIKTRIKVQADFYSDKEFIRIILENLIDNAIKFRSSSSRIEPFVSVTIDQVSGFIFIKVVDNGIGIRQKEPGKLFQMFSRGSERSQTGGIGLYITKTAVEKLHGEIRLRTTDEGFTEFFVQLPIETASVAG
ncbi:MAG TPA: HAMP domain-containing sensor histidine kinase, partial [Chryseosolibacter sp.]|nr:HAMP domain-containing sensor histidine kinase [Chryseosolibacter sp.]